MRMVAIEVFWLNGWGTPSSLSEDVRTRGQLTDNRAEDVRVIGQLTDNRAQDTRLTAQATDNRAQDTRVTGQLSSSQANEARITGVTGSNYAQDARLTGQATSNAAQDVRATGQITVNQAYDVRVKAQAVSSQANEARVTGQLSSNAAQDVRTFGILVSNTAQDVRTTGQAVTSSSEDVRVTGQLTSNRAQDVRVTASAPTNLAQEARVKGQATSSSAYDVRVTSENSSSAAFDARLSATPSFNLSQDVRVTGSTYASNSNAQYVTLVGSDTDFPANSTSLDTFTSGISGTWVALGTGTGSYANGLFVNDGSGHVTGTGSANTGAYWNSSFAGDMEAQIKIVTAPTGSSIPWFALYLRWDGTTPGTGYYFEGQGSSGTGKLTGASMTKRVAGTNTNLSQSSAGVGVSSIAVGDRVGVRVTGNTVISVWRQPGGSGAWQFVGAYNDKSAAITTGNFIGLGVPYDSTSATYAVLDEFAGGNFTQVAAGSNSNRTSDVRVTGDIIPLQFPAGNVVEDFSATLGANWTQNTTNMFGDSSRGIVASGGVGMAQNTSGAGGAFWNVNQYDDIDVWATISGEAQTAGGEVFALVVRADFTARNAYILQVNNNGSTLYRYAAGVYNALRMPATGALVGGVRFLDANGKPAMGKGDMVGLRAYGKALQVYWKPLGQNWRLVDSTSDDAYTIGYVGVEIGSQVTVSNTAPAPPTPSMDDFGIADPAGGTRVSRDQDARITGYFIDNKSQDVRVTASGTSNSSEDVRITAQLTISTSQDVRTQGEASTNKAQDVRTFGQGQSNVAYDTRVTGILTSNTAQEVRTQGQAVSNRAQDARATGQLTDNKAQDVRTFGILLSNTSQDARVTGQAPVSQAEDVRVTGQAVSSLAEESRVTGQAITSNAQDARTFGIVIVSDSQDVRVTAQATTSQVYEGRVTGQLTSNRAQDVRVQAQATVFYDQPARVTGQLTTNAAQDARVQGQAVDSRAQDARVQGQATSNYAQDARATGQITVSTSEDVRVVGQAVSNRAQDTRVTAQATDFRVQDARVTGQITVNSAQDVRTFGVVISSLAQEARLTAQATISQAYDTRITGQIITSAAYDVRTNGLGVSTNLSADVRVTAFAQSNRVQDARITGSLTSSAAQDARITAQATPSLAQEARVTAQLTDNRTSDVRLIAQATSFFRGTITNMVLNGGFESNVLTWITTGSGTQATITRDTTKAKFGTASAKIVTIGAVGAGAYWAPIVSIPSGPGGTSYTGSGWVLPDAGQQVYIFLRIGQTDASSFTGPLNQVTGDGVTWFPLQTTVTIPANRTTQTIELGIRSVTAAAFTFYMDGMQLETGKDASPYIETNGAAASVIYNGLDVRLTGQQISSLSEDVRVQGQATTNLAQDVRVTAQLTDNRAQDIRITGSNTSFRAQDIRLTAQATSFFRGTITNWLINGGAESGTTGWVPSSISGDVAFASSPTQAKFGTKSFHITASTGTLNAMRTTGFNWQPSTTYTISGWFYLTAVGTGVTSISLVAIWDSGPQHSGAASLNLALLNQWQFVSLTFTTNSGSQASTYVDAPRISGTQSSLTDLYADGLQAEFGPTATAYIETNGSIASVTYNGQDARLTAQLTTSASQDVRLYGDTNIPEIQWEVRVKAQAQTNRAQDSRITGQITTNRVQDARATGQTTSLRSQDARTFGHVVVSLSQPVKLSAEAKTSLSTEVRVSGGLAASTSQPVRVSGIANSYRSQDVRLVARQPYGPSRQGGHSMSTSGVGEIQKPLRQGQVEDTAQTGNVKKPIRESRTK